MKVIKFFVYCVSVIIFMVVAVLTVCAGAGMVDANPILAMLMLGMSVCVGWLGWVFVTKASRLWREE